MSFRDGVRLLLRERDDNDRKEQERMNKLLGRHLKKKVCDLRFPALTVLSLRVSHLVPIAQLEERTAELQDRLERERIRMEFERREEIKRIREEFLDRKFKNQQRDVSPCPRYRNFTLTPLLTSFRMLPQLFNCKKTLNAWRRSL